MCYFCMNFSNFGLMWEKVYFYANDFELVFYAKNHKQQKF